MIFQQDNNHWDDFLLIFIVLPLLALSPILLISYSLQHILKKRTFDFDKGYFYVGSKDPVKDRNKIQCRLTDIYALQILQKFTTKSYRKHAFICFEFNFVLKDASRINVINHGNYDLMIYEAKELCKLLDVHLWDTVQNSKKQA